MARENLFVGLLYGFEEIRQKSEEDLHSIQENEFKQFNDNTQYDILRKLAIEIETNLYTIHKHTDKYREKVRVIIVHLNHQNNHELRLKILFNQITPLQLATTDDHDLLNEENKKFI